MAAVKAVAFTYDERDYEVRVVELGDTFVVRAFLDGEPANGYSYLVASTTRLDIKHSLGISAADHLIAIAESDIRDRTYERISKLSRI
jgi:hypothetical protein